MTTEAAYRFRTDLLAVLAPMPAGRVVPVDEDTALVTCPACGGDMTVAFDRSAPGARITCHGGCENTAIRKVIGQRRAAR